MKSHFKFSKQNRSGIFLLLLIILLVHCFYLFVLPVILDSKKEVSTNSPEIDALITQIDALKRVELDNRKPKIYPFNPNYITDYKGGKLGLSNKEIDRLLLFRKKGLWVQSAKQFQEVTQVSDSLLNVLSPRFKFPDWVNKSSSKQGAFNVSKLHSSKTKKQSLDLNSATAVQLQKTNGIGVFYAEQIIALRTKLNGFHAFVELQSVYGLRPEVIQNLKKDFQIKDPRVITKIGLNTATKEQLVSIRYIGYEIAYNIIEARTLRDGFKSLEELTKVKEFPIKKIEIIKLSLKLD